MFLKKCRKYEKKFRMTINAISLSNLVAYLCRNTGYFITEYRLIKLY